MDLDFEDLRCISEETLSSHWILAFAKTLRLRFKLRFSGVNQNFRVKLTLVSHSMQHVGTIC